MPSQIANSLATSEAEPHRPFYQPLVDAVTEFFLFWGQIASLGLETFWYIFRGEVSVRGTVKQMGEVGVGSLIVACLTVGFSGAVAALYLAAQLVIYGQAGLAGGLVGKSLALEIAPVITAIVVAARSGSAMAAELGSMTVTEQVDALRTMGTSPVRYLVVPRVMGTILMMPGITAVANLAGLYGASLTSALGGVSGTLFWQLVSGLRFGRRHDAGLAQIHSVWHSHRAHRLPSGTFHQTRRAGRRSGHNFGSRFRANRGLRGGFPNFSDDSRRRFIPQINRFRKG